MSTIVKATVLTWIQSVCFNIIKWYIAVVFPDMGIIIACRLCKLLVFPFFPKKVSDKFIIILITCLQFLILHLIVQVRSLSTSSWGGLRIFSRRPLWNGIGWDSSDKVKLELFCSLSNVCCGIMLIKLRNKEKNVWYVYEVRPWERGVEALYIYLEVVSRMFYRLEIMITNLCWFVSRTF